MVKWRAAAAQYPIDRLDDWQGYENKLCQWLADAAGQGASLVVFPEYAGMELASLDPETMGSLADSIEAVSQLLPRVVALHVELAARFNLHILAGSAPCKGQDGQFRNAARLISPGGKIGVQHKLIMTRFEREEWGIVAGSGLNLFETELGRLAILICYDSEFPLLARAAAEAGAEVLLVPSCTDSLHGYWRVRHGAQARALEGQCYAVHAPTVGPAEWSPAVDINVGAAGIYAPPDGEFPADGVIALGVMDQPCWIYGDIDIDQVHKLRRDGQVLNYTHWAEQAGGGLLPSARIIDLR